MSDERALTIDSHQHFWKVSRGDYGWLDESVAPILRDFLPEDLAPLLRRAGIDRDGIVEYADLVIGGVQAVDVEDE